MKVYISGPITGDPDYKKKFSEAAERLRKARASVVDPTGDDRKVIKMFALMKDGSFWPLHELEGMERSGND